MANHKSAQKRDRQNKKINARNRHYRASVRTAIKKVFREIEASNLDEAAKLAAVAEKKIALAAQKGLYHRNNAARKIQRVYHRIRSAQSANA